MMIGGEIPTLMIRIAPSSRILVKHAILRRVLRILPVMVGVAGMRRRVVERNGGTRMTR